MNKLIRVSAVAAFTFLSAGVSAQTVDSLIYKNNPNYETQTELYKIYKTRSAKIVMLGNSITQGADWGELLDRPYVVQRAVPGDILSGFLARMDFIHKLNPKIVFILGGINDIYSWIPVETVFANYVKILEDLKARNIIPVIQSTLYSAKSWGKDFGGTPEINAGRNREVDKLNAMLKDYAAKNKIDFIDLNSQMKTDDDFLRPELTLDGLHLKAGGYKIWAAEVEKILRKYHM